MARTGKVITRVCLLCSSGKYLYVPHGTPYPSGNFNLVSYFPLNFLAFEDPIPPGIFNPFCGEVMDIF